MLLLDGCGDLEKWVLENSDHLRRGFAESRPLGGAFALDGL
ncbi:MAG: hypothetical protein JWO98_2052 [Frankiales bacterium]|nr:hypothetical protein [Frankiales bacterium]